jgi:hypothetical protein
MKTASKIAVLIPLCFIAGCRHKTQAAAPPPAPTKVYPPSDVAKDAPAPQLPPPKPVDVKPPGSDAAQEQPPPKPHKTMHHKPKPADTTQTQAAKDAAAQTAAATQQASAGEPPEMSPIGQLSSAGEHSGVPTRQQIQDLITSTENGLKDIKTKRSLSSDEQLTETQIRTFLTKARQALDQGDLDGANTLVTKAKVLLSELTKA